MSRLLTTWISVSVGNIVNTIHRLNKAMSSLLNVVGLHMLLRTDDRRSTVVRSLRHLANLESAKLDERDIAIHRHAFK